MGAFETEVEMRAKRISEKAEGHTKDLNKILGNIYIFSDFRDYLSKKYKGPWALNRKFNNKKGSFEVGLALISGGESGFRFTHPWKSYGSCAPKLSSFEDVKSALLSFEESFQEMKELADFFEKSIDDIRIQIEKELVSFFTAHPDLILRVLYGGASL